MVLVGLSEVIPSEGLEGEEANHCDLGEECLDRGNLKVESDLINKKAAVAEAELRRVVG